jgi:hypothetical protein
MADIVKFISVLFGAFCAIWGIIHIPDAVLSNAMGKFLGYTFLFFLGLWILGKTLKK